MNPLDDLTVCVTNFKRPNYLDRTLKSLRAAGIRRVAIASVEGGPAVEEIINANSQGWLSYDVARVRFDIGCNNTWMLAAYHSRTKRIIIMHDDDTLDAAFGDAYVKTIAPALDKGAGFASWRASLLFDDGTTEATEFWSGPTRVMRAHELLKVVGKKGRLSLSPIISVFDRQIVIQACKESEQTLTHDWCLHHPGMLLGTELVVYMRHIRKSATWLYVDQVLSHYGSHPGSGTIEAQKGGQDTLKALYRGYDLARDQGMVAEPKLKPKIIFVTAPYPPSDYDELARNKLAAESWNFHFEQFDVLDFTIRPSEMRLAQVVGEHDPVFFVRDLFDHGLRYAMPEDIIVYANMDVGLTTTAVERIVEGIEKGRGVTACPRRSMTPSPGRHYKHLANCRMDGGVDVVAITPGLWASKFRDAMPDFLVGREAWDTCFRVLAEEHADAPKRISSLSISPQRWLKSAAYTDHVCWHKPHPSKWRTSRADSPGQAHNRKLAREFFLARRFMDQVKAMS